MLTTWTALCLVSEDNNIFLKNIGEIKLFDILYDETVLFIQNFATLSVFMVITAGYFTSILST